jgi:hypothetical protein
MNELLLARLRHSAGELRMTATPDGYRLNDELFGDRLSVAEEWLRRVAQIEQSGARVDEHAQYGWMASVK